jgi:hypothetical protein
MNRISLYALLAISAIGIKTNKQTSSSTSQGANSAALHCPLATFLYRTLSCNLFGFPAQNSISSGTSLKPPQFSGGSSTPFPSESTRAATSAVRRASSSREGISLDWGLAQAPILLPSGLVRKYSIERSREVRAVRPTTRTERWSVGQ